MSPPGSRFGDIENLELLRRILCLWKIWDLPFLIIHNVHMENLICQVVFTKLSKWPIYGHGNFLPRRVRKVFQKQAFLTIFHAQNGLKTAEKILYLGGLKQFFKKAFFSA